MNGRRTGTRGHVLGALAGAMLLAPSLASAQHFTVNDTAVVQGRFRAVARSRDTIVSSYPRAAREVRFRFSINGLENEFPGGTEHTIYLRPVHGRQVTRVYRFADETEPPPPTPEQSASSEDGTAQLTVRVDMRAVLASLHEKGWYDPPLGARITRLDHLYVIGDPAPLDWDYGKLTPGSPEELTDSDGDGIYEGTIPIPTQYTRPTLPGSALAVWARHADLSAYPQLTSSQRIQDAVYRMSLEELTQLVRPDSALSAGAKWEGVWTRDISLSTILSLAIVAPDATRRSLMAKVDSTGRIIQDTGTGGSWPVSSDRMVWALAAWEIYAVTGDRAWLERSYAIVRRSAEADLHAVRDPANGLFRGESSFEDWREQSYPRWMQPADIYESENLGTNAVHYGAYRVLAKMARALGEPAAQWDSVADGIQRGMTEVLWQPARGWFGQYRYGRTYQSVSPRADGLGEALASIYGAASFDERRSLMKHAPVMPAGTPTFWPFIPGERFYHNATIWPFVTAYWTWAAAEGGNTRAVRRGLDDATRSAALFLTNKENMVAATGHYEGTALNSDRQLWSVAGTLAGTYRLLFGMRFEPERLLFRPMVPPSYGGERTLRGLHYRGAVLDVTVRGFGNGIASIVIDGARSKEPTVSGALTGPHSVVITMNGRWPDATVHEVTARFAPATPHATLAGHRISWPAIAGAARYVVIRNGRERTSTHSTHIDVTPTADLAEYQVKAVTAAGDESFLSEPVRVVTAAGEQTVKPAMNGAEHEYAGFTGAGYLRLTTTQNVRVEIPIAVDRDGDYAIDLRYANGNGPVNTEDKVGVRTLLADADTLGIVVLPQRGSGRWTEWGWSNVLRAHLTAGRHTITVLYTPLDANMNRRENTALLDAVRLTRLAPAH